MSFCQGARSKSYDQLFSLQTPRQSICESRNFFNGFAKIKYFLVRGELFSIKSRRKEIPYRTHLLFSLPDLTKGVIFLSSTENLFP